MLTTHHPTQQTHGQLRRVGILCFKGRIFLPVTSPLVESIIAMIHNGCHKGYQKTLYRVARDFYRGGMKK